MKNPDSQAPAWAEHWTLDEVAECMDYTCDDLYKLLWSLMAPEDPDRPFQETPDVLGRSDPNCLANHWGRFSAAQKRELEANAERQS